MTTLVSITMQCYLQLCSVKVHSVAPSADDKIKKWDNHKYVKIIWAYFEQEISRLENKESINHKINSKRVSLRKGTNTEQFPFP